MLLKLYSWNVNGIRALSGKPEWNWFAGCDGHIVGLQETKAEREQVPAAHRDPEGWKAWWLASRVKKGYSGVAVFSRVEPLAVHLDMPDPAWQGEGRCIHLEFPAFHYFNIYFPNGGQGEERLNYKLGFYDAFLNHAEDLRRHKPIVVCGDFNTAHRPIDLARPKDNEDVSGFLPVERAWMDRFTAAGYVDTFRLVQGDTPHAYSWWSYKTRARERNVGWRIDYFFVSEELRGAVRDAWIDMHVMGSDHCPVGLALDVDM
ncbi:exodeoxyribonuclease III [Desulfovibrio oxamicus]|uniref:Exodeoxyribonuclease III n=1 Tax=Nitratidesulfovibrio oxamicus TaxID=32016 RepID=A0ABS0J4H9_9BACT|nr:exodeoxyribonuclease III [Nitratidesulfovibrio oxamicus]MBG3877350.1 exodeoxyribonuclease III [Nitratidesulfovibrio oxamicus]